MFLAQMPVMHLGTFTVDGKPSILISAMQACGALYVRTHAAMKFIDDTLASARDQLVGEFVSAPSFEGALPGRMLISDIRARRQRSRRGGKTRCT